MSAPVTDKELGTRYPILRFFEHDHLDQFLSSISAPFKSLAWATARLLPYCAETSTALRKLLEAKDCAVRSGIDMRMDQDND
jgi:hypothetical protein